MGLSVGVRSAPVRGAHLSDGLRLALCQNVGRTTPRRWARRSLPRKPPMRCRSRPAGGLARPKPRPIPRREQPTQPRLMPRSRLRSMPRERRPLRRTSPVRLRKSRPVLPGRARPRPGPGLRASARPALGPRRQLRRQTLTGLTGLTSRLRWRGQRPTPSDLASGPRLPTGRPRSRRRRARQPTAPAHRRHQTRPLRPRPCQLRPREARPHRARPHRTRRCLRPRPWPHRGHLPPIHPSLRRRPRLRPLPGPSRSRAPRAPPPPRSDAADEQHRLARRRPAWCCQTLS